MKIISKYKDYYDYLQGIWGVDEKLVLDRTKWDRLPETDYDYRVWLFWIGDLFTAGMWLGGKLLFGTQLEQHGELFTVETGMTGLSWSERWDANKLVEAGETEFYIVRFTDGRGYKSSVMVTKEARTVTWRPKEAQHVPVLVQTHRVGGQSIFHMPRLLETGVQRSIPPEQAWQSLSAFLARQLDQKSNSPNTQTNADKIVAAGFDLKTSFRHPVKSVYK